MAVSNGKRLTVSSPDKNWDAGSYYIFLKCTTSGNTVTVTADANTGSEERTGSIIVTAGEESLEVTVIQEAKGGGSGGVNDPAGTADGYNPYPEYSFKVCENTMFLRDTVAQAITSANLENNTFTLSQNTPPEFVPQVGDYYIVNNRMDLFPDGMLMGIQEVRQKADGYSVVYYPVGLGSAFRDLEIQEQDIDISPYIRYIIDSDGNEVPFTRTRAVNTEKWSVTIPEIGWGIGGDWEFTPKLTLDNTLRVQLIMNDWSVSTLDVKYDVDATFGADVAISGEKEFISVHKKLATIVCGAIPVGPIVLTPNIDIFGWLSAGGSVSFEGSVTYKTGFIGNMHYDEVSYLSGDWEKKNQDEFKYSIGPKVSGKFEYGLQFGPAIGFYGAVLEAGITLSTTFAEEVSHKLNIADPMTWGYVEGWGQALQEGEYSRSFILGGNVFLSGLGFPLSFTLKDAKFPIESRNLIPTVSTEYRAEVDGKNLTFYTWIKNKALFYPDMYLDIGDGRQYYFDLDDSKINELENGADSVKITTSLTVEGDKAEYFAVKEMYRDMEATLRTYRNGSMILVDKDEEYAMKAILADIYACRGGDWDGCEWTTSNYGVANLPNIELREEKGGLHAYTILIPEEWPLGDNLYVGNHSGKVKNFSWSLDYEGDTHFTKVQIEDPNSDHIFIGPDCDTYIQHSTVEDPYICYPDHVKTLDLAGCNIEIFSYSPSYEQGFNPQKVILDNCPKLYKIALGSWNDYSSGTNILKNAPHISAKNCPMLTTVSLVSAEAFPGFFDNIEMNGGNLQIVRVTGLGDIDLKTGFETFRISDSPIGRFSATELKDLKEIDFSGCTFSTATMTNLPALKEVYMGRNVAEGIVIGNCAALEDIQIDSYYEEGYNVASLSVTNCASLKKLYCPNIGMSSFEASGLPVIESLHCENNRNLTGVMLPVFDQMFNAGHIPYYDVRYRYEWEELEEDKGYGYYYAGEPERGYHRYD